MKHLLLYILIAFSLTSTAKEYTPDYYIVQSVEDKTLTKNEAVFVIKFNIAQVNSVKNQIFYSYNNVSKKQLLDEDGQISIKIKPGKYKFKFLYDSRHYEVITDSIAIKPGYKTDIQVEIRPSDRPVLAKKPVIYVYPKQEEKISVKLKINGEFLFTYPEYKNGWDFIAQPDGTIQMNDKKYQYLFWDGKLNIESSKLNLKEGFIVAKKDLVNFFEEKLSLMGLNSREIEDYITFWYPLMNQNEKNYIHFIFNSEYDNYATLTIHPKPDHLFRVCMLWSKVDDVNGALIKDQPIENFKREGFTVVEWGGAEIKCPVLSNDL